MEGEGVRSEEEVRLMKTKTGRQLPDRWQVKTRRPGVSYSNSRGRVSFL